MKTCSACAQINKDEAAACKQCGVDFGPVGPPRLPAFAPRSHHDDGPARDPETRRRLAGWRRLASALVLVALAFLAMLVLLPAAPRATSSDVAASPSPTGALHVLAAGQGTSSTQLFQAPAQWQVTWKYDCRGVAPDGTGSFVASVRDSEKQQVGAALVSQIGPGDASIAHVSGAGSRYVQVESPCAWSLEIVAS